MSAVKSICCFSLVVSHFIDYLYSDITRNNVLQKIHFMPINQSRISKCLILHLRSFWIKNWPHIATHIVVLIVVEVKLYEKARGSVVSNRMRMKFDRIVLQVNTHRGWPVEFLRSRHSFKMAAMTSARRSLLLPMTACDVTGWLYALQFLIHGA